MDNDKTEITRLNQYDWITVKNEDSGFSVIELTVSGESIYKLKREFSRDVKLTDFLEEYSVMRKIIEDICEGNIGGH